MIETGIHKARSLQSSYITRQQCFIKILQPGSSAQPSILTKVAKMPTYTWNQTLEAKSRHCYWRHYGFIFTASAISGRSWASLRRNRVPEDLWLNWPPCIHSSAFHLWRKRCPTTPSCCNNCFIGIGEGPGRLCSYRTWKPSYSTIWILLGGIMVGLTSWRGVVSEQWSGRKTMGQIQAAGSMVVEAYQPDGGTQ